MSHRFVKTASVIALAALSTFAHAQSQLSTEDPGQMPLQTADADMALDAEAPGRVGRISLVQGKVTISGDVGDASNDALLNWPVTTRNLITSAPGARAELRIGSTAIRIDGDSSLEITELDDDSMRLRLHYGSASVRVANAEVAQEFELRTAQAAVRLAGPGSLRVDAERVRDTSMVSVFDGEATVDGAGASLTVRAGRSAEVRDEDVRTLQAQRDAFDDWSLERDRYGDGARSARYVTTEMTGYEELDRNGSWSVDAEYGNLWTPTVVADWAPYRDGRWTWVAPWGWTWVDNAAWGYAPFHYGRWVQVNRRWAWAPGQHVRRPVWSPALVGWVGGKDWNVGFHGGQRPATGWYPLGPRDRFVPRYRLSRERLERLNNYGWRNDNKGRGRDRDRDGRPDFRRDGLTVVPNQHFGGRAPIVVSNLPRANGNSLTAPRTPGAAPPPPQGWRERGPRNRVDIIRPAPPPTLREPALGDNTARIVRERNSWERDRDRIGRDRAERDRERFDPDRFNRDNRDARERAQRQPLLSTNPAPAAPLQPGLATGPAQQPGWQRPDRDANRDANRERWRERRDANERGEQPDRGQRPDRGGRGDRGDNGPRPQALIAAPQRQAPAPVMQQNSRPESTRPARGGQREQQDSR